MIETTLPSVWKEARVISQRKVADNVMGITLSVLGWPGHKAGQHIDVRLVASNGYVAERSYSLANAPAQNTQIELGVELLEQGEVSPFLWHLKPGDSIEIRGPIGGHFIWDPFMEGPLVLIGGGSGMVPLMSMLRHYVQTESNGKRLVIFIISLRALDKLLYKEELEHIQSLHSNVRIVITLTEKSPPDWKGYSRRIDASLFATELNDSKDAMPQTYICGPTKFVEAAADILLSLGFNSHLIRTERFG